MNDETTETELHLETQTQARLGSRVRHFKVCRRNQGVILQGTAQTYYAKQLAQHFVMELSSLPILANEIEVY